MCVVDIYSLLFVWSVCRRGVHYNVATGSVHRSSLPQDESHARRLGCLVSTGTSAMHTGFTASTSLLYVTVSNKCIAVRRVAAPLRELTCHMGSHSITCHPAQVISPPSPQPKLVLD